MAEVKEITTLNTVASVRKAAQQSMKPVIDEVQAKMQDIQLKMQTINEQFLLLGGLDKKIAKHDETNRYFHVQILSLSDKLAATELQVAADRQQADKNNQNLLYQFSKMRKQNEKVEAAFKITENRTNKTLQNIEDGMKRLKEKQLESQQQFRQFLNNSQFFKMELKKSNQYILTQFQKMRTTLSTQYKQGERRLQLLDMYESEKEATFQKLANLSFRLESCIKSEEFEFYKTCNIKEQQRVIQEVKKIFQANLSDNTRQLINQLPQFKEEIKQCITMERNLKQVNNNVEAIQKVIKSQDLENKLNKRALQDDINKKFKKIEQDKKNMQINIQEALSLRDLIKTKIDEYSDQLKAQLRYQNEQKNKELYEQIKRKFSDKQEKARQKQLQKIIEERKLLFNRCEEIGKIGDNLAYILNNYSTKFTKLRSDNELFVQKISKQLGQIDIMKFQIQNNNSVFGKIIAELTQSVLAVYCLSIHQKASVHEQVMLTTQKDGIIYQKIPNISELGRIVYRRKSMDPTALRKAVAFSLIEAYDLIMNEDNCLKWKTHSPNNFFRQTIEPTYNSLIQKRQIEKESRQQKYRQTLDLSTIPARQTISSSFDRPYQTRNIATSRSKRSRYTENDNRQIFAYKSTRRFRIPLNSSLGMT